MYFLRKFYFCCLIYFQEFIIVIFFIFYVYYNFLHYRFSSLLLFYLLAMYLNVSALQFSSLLVQNCQSSFNGAVHSLKSAQFRTKSFVNFSILQILDHHRNCDLLNKGFLKFLLVITKLKFILLLYHQASFSSKTTFKMFYS